MSNQNEFDSRVEIPEQKRVLPVADLLPQFVAHPSDILYDPVLSLRQKRLILSDWLSDAHAVPGAPRWRELENGAFVDVYDLRAALRVLDEAESAGISEI